MKNSLVGFSDRFEVAEKKSEFKDKSVETIQWRTERKMAMGWYMKILKEKNVNWRQIYIDRN